MRFFSTVFDVLDVNIPNPGTLVDLAQTALHASVSSQQLPTKAEESIREFTEGMTDMSLSIVYAVKRRRFERVW